VSHKFRRKFLATKETVFGLDNVDFFAFDLINLKVHIKSAYHKPIFKKIIWNMFIRMCISMSIIIFVGMSLTMFLGMLMSVFVSIFFKRVHRHFRKYIRNYVNNNGQYSQHSIFFATYKCTKYARVCFTGKQTCVM
jgi:hypothetical protein